VFCRNAACFCEMPRCFAKFRVILPNMSKIMEMRLEWNYEPGKAVSIF
jgi:hypothetical protein